ncbi:MAG: ABC transporter permease [Bifidobacteriaceae bacterium]|jgi:simple sugar transport system permease protein|nr:ABC transporter permease [Bifidobacteriaceae bacterium]
MNAAPTKPRPRSGEDIHGELAPPISWKAPIAFAVLAITALFGFALFTPGSLSTKFIVSTSTDFFEIAPFTVPSRTTASVAAVILVALAAHSWQRTSRRAKTGAWLPVVFGLGWIFAFLVWVLAGNDLSVPLTGLLGGALFLSVPLVFGSMAGLVCERVGVINVAIEGQLLAGAFLAAVVATLAGNAYAGMLAAPLAGALIGALLALFAVRYWVDQIIVGVVLNVLVTGVTSYLFSTVLTQKASTWNSPPPLPVLAVPGLSQIPVIGPVLFRQTALVYLMYALVAVLQVMLFKSRWGLRMRACGEHPKAADTVGIKVNRTRVRNTILGGAIAGLGGAFFTVALGLAFGKDMSAGRGFIALAAMILGRWNPKGALAAALLFGFADQLQVVLSPAGTVIPSQILLMTPYLVTVLAVAGLVGRVTAPAAEGKPYKG